MKKRHLAVLPVLAALGILVTGCEWGRWLRLLSLKKQWAHVERHVRVEDKEGLSITFIKPVVYADDVRLLIDGEMLRSTNRNQESWSWIYEKQSLGPHLEAGDYGMSITFGFENHKFNRMQFSDRFLTLMPKPVVLGMLRAVGRADLDIKRGTADVKWVGVGPGETVQLPTRQQILTSLGTPFLITESNQTRTLLYKYYQKTVNACLPAEQLAWAKFTIRASDDQVLSSEGAIGSVGWGLTRVADEAEPRVIFAMSPLSVEPVTLQLPPEVADEYVGLYGEPGGTQVSLGRDGDTLVACWKKEPSGGWCTVAPEATNIFFGLPMGTPRFTFLRSPGGAVTGLVTKATGPELYFTKTAAQLPPGPTTVKLDPQVYAACAGWYKGSWGGMAIISHEGERLFWQNPGVQARVPLYAASETNFFFKAVESPLTFERNEKGEVTQFVLRFCGKTATAVKQKGH
jgi:hypothetical protein